MDVRSALDIIVGQGLRLFQDLCLQSWTLRQQEWAAALRFLQQRDWSAGAPVLAAIIGGASSGKSTVFNNLLGARHASHVTVLPHTTRGLILAVDTRLERIAARWLDDERTLLPDLPRQTADADDRTEGSPEALTVIPVHHEPLRDVLLFDTPDFTTHSARREGDLTCRLLAWFDRVIVLVDEERWYDEQTFGRLRDELNRLRTPRMILFNCNEGIATLTDEDRQRLQSQAISMTADHRLIEYQPGQGFRRLPEEVIHACVDWIHRSEPEGASRRLERIGRLVADGAGQALNENARRLARLEELKTTLREAVDAEVPGRRDILWNVIFTNEQRRRLQPYWRTLGRTVDWFVDLTRRPGRAFRLAAGRDTGPADEPPEDPCRIGCEYFLREAQRLSDVLANRASAGRFAREAGPSPFPAFAPAAEDDVLRAAAQSSSQACADALGRLEAKVAAEAVNLRVNLTGAAVGGAIGALLAAPTGGLSIPAGALLGAVITGVPARLLVRLWNVVTGTSERRDLDRAVEQYRLALQRHADATASRILAAARDRTLDGYADLRLALETLRQADEHWAAGPGSLPGEHRP
jgi:hypothetical protein